MRNFYSMFLAVVFTASTSAQELIPNGGFENWTESIPDSWIITISDNGGSINQSNDAQEGNFSALLEAPIGTGNNRLGVADFEVEAGVNYTFSYWYKDESPDARMRHWASWRDENGLQIDADLDILHGAYLPNSEGWQIKTLHLTAPENAAKFRMDFRIYREGAVGVEQYIWTMFLLQIQVWTFLI